jgi:hypothetical protein
VETLFSVSYFLALDILFSFINSCATTFSTIQFRERYLISF